MASAVVSVCVDVGGDRDRRRDRETEGGREGQETVAAAAVVVSVCVEVGGSAGAGWFFLCL